MSGYRVDPDALREAVKDLKEARKRVDEVREFALNIDAGELTAGDRATQAFRSAVSERAVGSPSSLEAFAAGLSTKLGEKIASYEATIQEYQDLDDAARADQIRSNPQA